MTVSPYVLPDGNIQIAFSGGRTGAFMLHASGLTKSWSAAFWSKRYSRREMREFVERQGDWALSTEGALCQADDGECSPL